MKKLHLNDLKVEGFATVERGGVAVLEVTQGDDCGDTQDIWACQSFERCPESHPYQKICI